MNMRCVSLGSGLVWLFMATASAQTGPAAGQPAPATPPPAPASGGCFEDLIGEGQSSVGLSVQYPVQRVIIVRAWATAVAGSTLKITHGGGACSQAQAASNPFPVKLAVTCVRTMKPAEVVAVSIELTPPQEGVIHAEASCGQ